MRSDMAKVIVERPRIFSRHPSRKKGYRKSLQSVPLDELPRRELMLGRWKGRGKYLNEHLGPMRRFLRSNIGRPWNKVHQELCEHVSFDNAVQAHVLAHIYEYVHLHVEVEDKATVYMKKGKWYRHMLGKDTMYVCPNSGILKVVQGNRRHPPADPIPKDTCVKYLQRGSDWWEVHLSSTENVRHDCWLDVWSGHNISELSEEYCIRTYGYANLFAKSMRRIMTPADPIPKDTCVKYLKRDNVWWEVHLRSTENVRHDCWLDVWTGHNISQSSERYSIENYGYANLFAKSIRRIMTWADPIPKDTCVKYLKRDNVWWEVHLRSTENVRYDRWDVWLECNISQLTQQDCVRTYGGNLFATSKRPLTPHETRQLYREIRQKSRGRSNSPGKRSFRDCPG